MSRTTTQILIQPPQSLSLSLHPLMARTFYQTLSRLHPTPSLLSKSSTPPYAPSSRFLNHRNRSNQSEKSTAQLIEVDLDPESDVEVMGMRRLEDAIHGIIVRRSAPDWLPFVPGSSYWVPPRKRPYGIVELVGKLANPLSEEETMSLTTARGWPSATYFSEGGATSYPVLIEENLKNTCQPSEDEEG